MMRGKMRTSHLVLIKTLLIFLVGSIITVVFAMSNSDNEGELVFTSILFRHGQRNPEVFLPYDTYNDTSFWPEGLGALTKNGKLQLYKLGQWLRKRYDCLIPDGKYSRDIMYVRSTDVDRTIMSALSCLAGMFYPSQEEMWSDIPWQPIPVHTQPMSTDKELLILFTNCPKIAEEEQRVRDSDVVKEYNEEHKELYKHLTTHSGVLIEDPQWVRILHITMRTEAMVLEEKFKCPDWAQHIFPDKLYSVDAFAANMMTMTKTLKRLRGGPLLKEIITHMKKKRDGTLNPNRNIWMYSAHDVTIFSLLGTMGVFDPHVPPFSATVMVELRKRDGDFYVSVYYKKEVDPIILTIPGCTPSCPLDKFESLLSDVIPEDYEKECQSVNGIIEGVDSKIASSKPNLPPF